MFEHEGQLRIHRNAEACWEDPAIERLRARRDRDARHRLIRDAGAAASVRTYSFDQLLRQAWASRTFVKPTDS